MKRITFLVIVMIFIAAPLFATEGDPPGLPSTELTANVYLTIDGYATYSIDEDIAVSVVNGEATGFGHTTFNIGTNYDLTLMVEIDKATMPGNWSCGFGDTVTGVLTSPFTPGTYNGSIYASVSGLTLLDAANTYTGGIITISIQ